LKLLLFQKQKKRENLLLQNQEYEVDYKREQALRLLEIEDNLSPEEDEPPEVKYNPPVDKDTVFNHAVSVAELSVIVFLFELSKEGTLKKSQLLGRGLDPRGLVKDNILTKKQDNITGLWYYTVNLPKELNV